MLPDFERVDAIGTFWGHPETRTFGELRIDLEEDRRRERRCSAFRTRRCCLTPRPKSEEPRVRREMG
jgi:hypothetical protein